MPGAGGSGDDAFTPPPLAADPRSGGSTDSQGVPIAAAPTGQDGTAGIDDSGVPGSDFVFENPFEDVEQSDWFYSSVMAAYLRGLMDGTSADPMLFSPDAETTRGMLVTVLYRHYYARINGSEAEKEDNAQPSNLGAQFEDVPESAWYFDAVQWAAERKIVYGYGGGEFGPGDAITRQDMVAILARYADYIEKPIPAELDYPGFADEADAAGYAKGPIERFYCAGIVFGKPGGIFDPTGLSTRAEFAAMLARFTSL